MRLDSKLNGLGSFLVSNGYLDEEKAHHALSESIKKRIPFIFYLGQQSYVSYRQLAEAIANYLNLSFFDLSSYDLNLLPKEFLSAELIQKHFALPLIRKGEQLLLGISEPGLADINEIRFLTGLNPVLTIVEIDKLTKIIDVISTQELEKNLQLDNAGLDVTINELSTKDLLDNDLSELKSDQSPVVQFLNQKLFEALTQRASDIHFEPYENYFRIRFRVDGILHEISRESLKLANFLTARLKIMANLDISERRIPQDGRFKIALTKNLAADFRLNTCPTLFGEKAVLRILGSPAHLHDINSLGMSDNQIKIFLNALCSSQGLILVTGPTGSGKTVTLYSALKKLNTESVNISSVEDPIEIYLPGINQVQINPKTGLSFATALRAFLRQDPDIIMLGEIRDLEAGEIALRAAQTGHLVLSTLHTTSAATTLMRLSNMGLASFNIASSVILIIAQRLVRCLCPHCKEKKIFAEQILLREGFSHHELKDLIIYKAKGCNHCHQGYKGQIGLYELLPISKDLSELITTNIRTLDIALQARKEKMLTLRLSGLEKVKQGLTTLEEINRVVSA